MLNSENSLEFFLSIPDDILAEIADKDWESLETLCWALSLELQQLRETADKKSNIVSC
jgi:hypothetical protein